MSVESCRDWEILNGLHFPVLADPDNRIMPFFDTLSVPYSGLLDCNRVIRMLHEGFDPGVLDTIENLLETGITTVSILNHEPRPDTEDISNPIPIHATLEYGLSFSTGFPQLAWNLDGGTLFNTVPMLPDRSHAPDRTSRSVLYTAEIPPPMVDTSVYYYIQVANDAGCGRFFPFDAPAERYTFYAGPDTTPPLIAHVPLDDCSVLQLPRRVDAIATDGLGVASVTLEFRINGGPTQTIPMQSREGYTVEAFAGLSPGDQVQYRIAAVDQAQSPNSSFHPTSGYHAFSILENVPVLIIDLENQKNSGPVLRDGIRRYFPDAPYMTSIPQELSTYDSIFLCLGVRNSGPYFPTDEEENRLATYLFNGGNLYLESGEIWLQSSGGPLMDGFDIQWIGSGNAETDTGPFQPGAGSFAADPIYYYSKDTPFNGWINRIEAVNGSVTVLKNVYPIYDCMVASNRIQYRTIGSNIKFGGIQSTPDGGDPERLLAAMLTFFGLDIPEPTPTPTRPPDDCQQTGVTVEMPAEYYTAGDPCRCDVVVCNAGTEALTGYPVFVLLDVYGQYYFAPSFSSALDSYLTAYPSLPVGETRISVLPEFAWPQGAGSATGILFHAAIVTPDVSGIFGTMSSFQFGWGE